MTLSAMRKTYSSRLWVSYQPTNEVAPSKPTPHFSTKPTFFTLPKGFVSDIRWNPLQIIFVSTCSWFAFIGKHYKDKGSSICRQDTCFQI